MINNLLDVIIIGAGPIGLSCGIEAVKRNYTHLIIEKGCLVNSLFNYPINMIFFSTSERLEIGEVPFVSHGDKPTRRESLEYFRRVKHAWKLNVNTYETALDIKKNQGGFSVRTTKAMYSSRFVIIAIGFYDKPNMLDIPGEELSKVKHYFDEAHPYAYHKVVVVGGGNSAVDVALETFRRGSQVTMVVREKNLKDGIKYWVKPDIENRIKEGSIAIYFNSNLKEIRGDEVDITTPQEIITIKNDFVFAMTGYHPDFTFLKQVGITLSVDEHLLPSFDENTFETNIKNIYMAGAACCGMDTSKWFIENSRYHAKNIFDDMESKKERYKVYLMVY